MKRSALAVFLSLAAAGPALAQALPRISSLYPPGAKAGDTLDVSIRGGGIEGAREVVIDGAGLTAKLNEANVKINPDEQKVFNAKCGLCHEMRGPATISRTADQWVATVDRMIKDKGAPIEPADREKIVNYVSAAARAAAGLTARITLAADAAPGPRLLRIVGVNGASTSFPFEVTRQTEALEAEPNNAVDKAPSVTMPLTVSGQLAQSDVDCFSFTAKQGERIVANCSAYRLNEASQGFFFPVLYLYDEKGKELAKNTGYFGIDPLIDFTAPAAGKYVIMVRDMLYRGSPSSVYRLSLGSLPYKTYLFPAGGKRGATTEAAVSGENMSPATASVALEAEAPLGVRRVSTPHGSFPFVVGDEPEVMERPGADPQPITLPAALNGRIDAASTDRYTFTVEKDKLGAYSFELFANRIDSPLVARLSLVNAKGQQLVSAAGTPNARDPRIDYTFRDAGEYSLMVQDEAGKFSPAHVYRVRATPAAPDFLLTISPDNPNLGPGSSLYLPVRVVRRVGVTGDIAISFPDLPPGVTASKTVVRPDQNQAFVILTAAPDAQPGQFKITEPVGSTVVDGKTIQRNLVPYEVYLLNNNQQYTERRNLIVTLGPAPEWTATVEPETGPVGDGESVEVKVKLNRKNAERDMPFAIVGVPNGVQAPNAVLFKKGQNEVSFTMRGTSGGIFQTKTNAPTHFMLAVVNGREGEGMQMSSPPVSVPLKMPPSP